MISSRRIKPSRSFARRPGAVLVLVVLLLPIFLLIVGFSIDLAHIQLSRTELRLAVDAAARAGAEELARSESVAAARKRARDVAEMNMVANRPLSLANRNIEFGRSVQSTNGSWSFAKGGSPANAVRVVGMRTKSSKDGQLNLLMGWYSQREGLDLSVPATAAFHTCDISLVLDRSTSMKMSILPAPGPSYDFRYCRPPLADSGWKALDDAVDIFLTEVQRTNADERVSLVTFASQLDPRWYCGGGPAATLNCGLTSDIGAAHSAMNQLMTSVWNGNTNIAAGVDLGSLDLTKSPNSRALADKFMLVMTDGMANEGNVIASATNAADLGIKISTVTFGPGANQESMKQVAEIGGGLHYHAEDAAALQEVFRKFAAQTALIVQ